MAEFYITYDRDGQRCLAIVTAAQRPDSLQFGSRDQLVETMDMLAPEWQLQSEIQLPDGYPPITAAWLECMAEAGRLKQLPKPHGSLLGSGSEGGESDA